MSTTGQLLIESGPFRINTRARIAIDFEAEDLVSITLQSPALHTEVVLSGEHLAEFRLMLAQAEERLWVRQAALERQAIAS